MPIAAPIITTSILGAAPDLVGPKWLSLATAVGIGVGTWIVLPTSVILTGVVTGTVGAGVVTGKIFLPPTPLPFPATFAAAGFTGPESARVALGIGLGLSAAINASAGYLGSSTGAIGADLSKVIFADPASLGTILIGSMNANGLNGPQAQLLAGSLASGIATMLLTGVGTGAAAGVPGPSPGVGVSRSQLI